MSYTWERRKKKNYILTPYGFNQYEFLKAGIVRMKTAFKHFFLCYFIFTANNKIIC